MSSRHSHVDRAIGYCDCIVKPRELTTHSDTPDAFGSTARDRGFQKIATQRCIATENDFWGKCQCMTAANQRSSLCERNG